jgi:hypothetical protein
LERTKKKILIFDETGFARICNALLESEGHWADINPPVEMGSPVAVEGYDLLITSYPYGDHFLNAIPNREIALIVLSDCINSDLLFALDGFDNCFCMIKPLDFDKFRSLVNQVIGGQPNGKGGYQIV